ncbi:hypothetical protein J7M23_13055 [Candidatus Sumerlaeota bacterium]|nr:hypothetical protein [Candidatus Sumerlaeota bacterium]
MLSIGEKRRTRTIIVLSLVAVIVGVVLLFYNRATPSIPFPEPVFDGDSRELNKTKIVATLDTPLQRGTNVIWCASFLSAWKTLETELAKEPISVQGNPEIVLALNKAPDPRPYIPKACLYVATGWNQEGIVERIMKDLSRKFPTKAPPTFSGILPNSFVAYAYLEAKVKFSIPYFQNRKPLVFTDNAGNETELSSFGIRPEDEYAYFKLRKQPAVLFRIKEGRTRVKECVVDLDRTSKPSQIILALVEPKSTLAETLEYVEEKIVKTTISKEHSGLGPNDVLLVPDMVWRISHHFTELEGSEFMNAKLRGQRIDTAQQDIEFCLNRSGAELSSESRLHMLPIPTYYVFNRPFFLYMKKRGAKLPYFVMWIENAELLNRWKPIEKPHQNVPSED